MRVYETRIFSRFARKESIKGKQLLEAVQRASDGLIDADLGGASSSSALRAPAKAAAEATELFWFSVPEA